MINKLKEWKLSKNVSYKKILYNLGGYWSLSWVMKVFNAKATPGILLAACLSVLTGLSLEDVYTGSFHANHGVHICNVYWREWS